MIKKIYLDMDGVLCDFNKRFIEVNSIHPSKVKGTFVETEYWSKFVKEGHFSTLDWNPGGIELWNYISSFNIPIEILSSSGGYKFHGLIRDQKEVWLRLRDINIPANIVPSKKHKKTYANPSHVLIDDVEKNIVEFVEAGGKAIHHKTFEETKHELEKFLKG